MTIHQPTVDAVSRFAFRFLLPRKASRCEFAPNAKGGPMQWTSERDAADAAQMHHALVLQADSPIETAYIEFWKRILSDGCAQAASAGWQSLGIEICERQRE